MSTAEEEKFKFMQELFNLSNWIYTINSLAFKCHRELNEQNVNELIERYSNNRRYVVLERNRFRLNSMDATFEKIGQKQDLQYWIEQLLFELASLNILIEIKRMHPPNFEQNTNCCVMS